MAGEKKFLRKRKSPPSRLENGAASTSNEQKSASDVAVFDIDKHPYHHRPKKNVIFQGRGDRTHEEEMDSTIGYEKRLPANGRRTRLASAISHSNVNGDSDFPLRINLRQRRSVSAHPTLRTQPIPKPVLTRMPSKTCLSPRTSQSGEPAQVSSRSTSKSRQRVERLKLKSSDTDSSDSEDDTPRPSSRPSSQPLSPEIIASLTSQAEQNKQAWAHFSQHVKLIDDSTGLISRHPRKTFSSSSVFRKAMLDLYGNAEYGKSRGFSKLKGRVNAIAACASTLISAARRATAEKEEEDEEMTDEEEGLASQETIENARRGWRILRQYVQEMAAEKRMSQSNLTWSMLTHTIRGLSNMERTRYELYQKYGLVPMVLSDGTVIQENTMLSERTRAALAAKASAERKSSSVAPRLQSASSVHNKYGGQTYRVIGGYRTSHLRAETV